MEGKDLITCRIAATLQDGAFPGEKRQWIVISYCAFVVCMIAAFAFLASSLLSSYAREGESVAADAITVTVIAAAILLLIGAWGYLIVRNARMRKHILQWLEDAAELSADAKVIDVQRISLLFPRAKVQVSFVLEGRKMTRESGKQGKIGSGYQSFWMRYDKRPVRILYSARYDQVMILKDT